MGIPRLYISDLDHTLLRKDRTLSPFAVQAVNRLYEENILFTIASARSLNTMQPMLNGLQLHLPIIGFNGGYITNLTTGIHECIHAIEKEVARDIWEIGTMMGEIPSISTTSQAIGDKLYCTDPHISQGMQLYIENRKKAKDARLTPMIPIDGVLESEVLAFTFISTDETILPIKAELARKYGDRLSLISYWNEYSPEWFWLTVHDRTSTKENAIQQLRQRYNLQDHELVTFGDNVNDIGMIKAATRGYAVENGKAELKQVATGTIGDHETDSVLRFILKENNLE